ncbi:MAG: hypothetical protein KDC03_05195 [Flavobacteriales bacterium]|nr:hypothetical protein [Flavobacteriales bacterium]MCB0783250.1 hypothetical protein [Flavobacteriales bacterium]
MNTIILLISWLGTFLLAIEAMKIGNFRKLSGNILKLRIAINPSFTYAEDGNIYYPKTPKGYKWLRKLAWFIELLLGYAIILIITAMIGQLDNLIDILLTQSGDLFIDVWYIVVIKLWIALIAFFLIPGLIGNRITYLFTKFADKYDRFLLNLEETIAAGTIGLFGFGILSIAYILSVIKENYNC